MARMQRFSNVCDGGHILDLDNLTPESLRAALGVNRKAVLVVGNDQRKALDVLKGLARKKISGLRLFQRPLPFSGTEYRPLRAKRLAAWSPTAQLWMVRQDGRKIG